MAFTFTTSGAMVFKAGKNIDSTIASSGAVLLRLSNEAEAYINSVARVDLVTAYSSLTTEGKAILGMIASAHAAKQLIKYDMSGYTSRNEAQTMLDVNDDEVVKGLKLIEDDKYKTYLNAT